MRVRLTPDSIAYFNVSRNLAAGEGFVSTLRLRYPDEGGVRHSALSDWPPAYPAFSAVRGRMRGRHGALQAANALLASISAGFVFLLGVRLFGTREGLLAGAAAALAPNLFRAGIVALSDALGLTLALAAILIALGDRGAWKWLIAGLLAGAAALTRYPNAVVGLALIGWVLTDRKSRRGALACAAGFAMVVGTRDAVAVAEHGILPCRMQTLHYCVRSFHEAMWNAGTAIDPFYALHHPGQVALLSMHNVCFYAV